jgi:hypothetical protein
MSDERAYLRWLVETFCMSPDGELRFFEHHMLTEQMFRKDYYYIVRNDENRAEDGTYLRYLYHLEHPGATIPQTPCSFLEFLIGVGRRLSEILAEGEELPVYLYFWELAANLGLDVYNDERYGYEDTPFIVDDIMNRLMDRKYDRKGVGGLFPLEEEGHRNQRRLEVWYQMQDYMFENPHFFQRSA